MNVNHTFSEQWMRALVSAGVQVTLLIIAVIAATLLLRRSRPVVRYALWSVVLIRLCLPFGFTTPLGLGGVSREFEGWIVASPVTVLDPAAPLRFESEAGKSILKLTSEKDGVHVSAQ